MNQEQALHAILVNAIAQESAQPRLGHVKAAEEVAKAFKAGLTAFDAPAEAVCGGTTDSTAPASA